MAYVFDRNGFWFIGWKDHLGIQRKKKTTLKVGLRKDEKAAEQLARDAERQAEKHKYGQEKILLSRRTFGEVGAEYLQVEACSMPSYQDIEGRLRRYVFPHLGKMLIVDIAPADIKGTLNKARWRYLCEKKSCSVGYGAAESATACPKCGGNRDSKQTSPQTLNHIRNHISSVFRFAIESRNELAKNPVAMVEREILEGRDPVAIPPECVQPIIHSVPDNYRGLFATAAYSGLRKGEVFGLKWSDVDLERLLFSVIRSHSRSTTKGRRTRHVPIHPDLVPYLKAELARKRSEFVFPGPDGKRMKKWTKVELRLRAALVRAGITIGFDHYCRRKGCGFRERRADSAQFRCPKCQFKLSVNPVPPHWNFKDLRSTIATMAYEATNDMRVVQKLLGHRDLETTEKAYAKFRAGRLAEGLARVQFPVSNSADFVSPRQLPAQKEAVMSDNQTEQKVLRIRGDK